MHLPALRQLLLVLTTTLTMAQTSQDFLKEAEKCLEAKRYTQAAGFFAQAYEKDPFEVSALYNAACCLALAGEKEPSFRYLDRAVQAGFSDAEGAAKDADLEGLHGDARWAPLLQHMRTSKERAAAFWDGPSLTSGYQEQLPENERIAGLSRFWSEVKFNFYNTDRLAEIDWDGLYLKALPKVRAAPSTAAYYKVLAQLCAQLKDGHTNVTPAREVWQVQEAQPLIRTRLVEGRVLVTDVGDETLRAKGVVPGVEVATVDGLPAKHYAENQLAPTISASTPQDLETRMYVYEFLSGPLAEAPLVGFKTSAGGSFSLHLPRVDYATRKKAFPPRAPFILRMLPGGVAHVRLNTFNDSATAEQFLAAFQEIVQAKALILDVRDNGGGNSGVGHRILATLADHPFATSTWTTRDYKPTFRAWGRPAGTLRGEASLIAPDPAHHFAGPVFLLTGPATYSAAEDFAMAFDAMQRGRIIGEATGGSTGQPLMFKLPGGGSARVCTKLDSYPDGRAFVGVGIQPGQVVRPTVADFRGGRDTVLEAALEALAKRPNP